MDMCPNYSFVPPNAYYLFPRAFGKRLGKPFVFQQKIEKRPYPGKNRQKAGYPVHKLRPF
jgi:hypothetical protein